MTTKPTEGLLDAAALAKELRERAEWRAAHDGPFTKENLVEWRAANFLAALTASPPMEAVGVKGLPVWSVGTWGDGSTPPYLANIFCDAYEITVAAGIPKGIAADIVAAHNETLAAPLSNPEAPAPTSAVDGAVAAVRLRNAGAMLANAAYNIHQRGEINEASMSSLKEAQEAWDAALAGNPLPSGGEKEA